MQQETDFGDFDMADVGQEIRDWVFTYTPKQKGACDGKYSDRYTIVRGTFQEAQDTMNATGLTWYRQCHSKEVAMVERRGLKELKLGKKSRNAVGMPLS